LKSLQLPRTYLNLAGSLAALQGLGGRASWGSRSGCQQPGSATMADSDDEDVGGFGDAGFEEDQETNLEAFQAAAEPGENLNVEDDAAGEATDEVDDLAAEVADVVEIRAPPPTSKSGWLHYKTQKSSFMTMGRKKAQFKEYWFVLKDGKLTMHKMANTDPISTLELPYSTITDEIAGPDGQRQFIISTKKHEYWFQGKSLEYANEWLDVLRAAKRKARRRSQYGRQTSAAGKESQGATALMF